MEVHKNLKKEIILWCVLVLKLGVSSQPNNGEFCRHNTEFVFSSRTLCLNMSLNTENKIKGKEKRITRKCLFHIIFRHSREYKIHNVD